MARVTIEDCLENVDTRFELVLVAARRARQIARGAEILVDENRDKPTVLALREVAAGKMSQAILDEMSEREKVQRSMLSEEELAETAAAAPDAS